jgi:hypothetical protein
MTVLRINLHIRADVSPQLQAALADMPPRPRAERLRRLAELGLQIESGQLHSQRIDSSFGHASRPKALAVDVTAGAAPGFADDLAGLLSGQFEQITR